MWKFVQVVLFAFDKESKKSYNRNLKSFKGSFIFNDNLMRKVNATAPRGKCYRRMVDGGLIKNMWGYYND